MMDIDVADIVAVLLIAGCFILKYLGINSTVNSLLLTVAAFYFGIKTRHVLGKRG